MDDAFFMMFTEAPSGRVIAILGVVDEPPALKRLVVTGSAGVYDLHLNPAQVDQLAEALKK